MRRVAKSGTDGFSKKAPCESRDVSKSTTNETQVEIPGVDQLDAAPVGSLRYVPGDFQAYESALLAKRASRALDRTAIFIAPRIGWPKSIYWKGAQS